MGASDFTAVTGSSDDATIFRNIVATDGAPPAPPGQTASYVYGARAITAGVFALYANDPSCTPLDPTKSAQVTIALRAHGGAQPFLFANLQGPSQIDGAAYELGIDPSGLLTLAKGTLDTDLDEPSKILRRASSPIAPGAWVHVRLDCVANSNGDNIIHTFVSSSGSVLAPTWERALEMYIDDALGARSGAKPLRGGYLGYGMKSAAGGGAYFAHVGTQRGA